jgi:hypothetical protein
MRTRHWTGSRQATVDMDLIMAMFLVFRPNLDFPDFSIIFLKVTSDNNNSIKDHNCRLLMLRSSNI